MLAPKVTWLLATPFNVVIVGPPAIVEAETSNVATQAIAGTVTAGEAAVGATVTLFDTHNGVTSQIGTATVGAGGNWSTSVTLSGDGAHSIVAKSEGRPGFPRFDPASIPPRAGPDAGIE